jgi:hypothetical protein
MITANNNIDLNSAQQKDKFIVVGGKENLVVDSRGKVYPMGGVPPAVAPTTKVITGGGSLTPGIGYSYAYTYVNTYQDSETEPSPASAYIGRTDTGTFKTVRFSEDGLSVYISGEDIEKEDHYYDGQTIAIQIVNDEYVNVYSQWQYRKVKNYEYDAVKELGVFSLNRAFFNVDPDEADQVYDVKLEDLEMEDGIVGGKAKGNNKLVLDANASQTPADYRFKTIHIVAGKGKGQKRIIVDATQREDGLIEITVDAPWKEKPKFLDPDKKDLYTLREQNEKQKGTKRPKNFYKKYYSSEYVISDPLRYNGFAIDANVDSYDDKGRRVKLSGLGHSGDLLTGKVVSYKDAAAAERDTVTIVLDGDNDTTSTADTSTYTNKRFRIFDGAGAGLDARIHSVSKATDNRVTLKIDVYGKMKKKNIPNASSKCVIYAGESLSAQMVCEVTQDGTTKRECVFPRIFGASKDESTGITTLVCCGQGGLIDSAYLCATEAGNVETYNNGKCYIMFKVKDNKKNVFYISRPIISASSEEITEKDLNDHDNERTYQRIYIQVSDLPRVNNEEVEVYFGKDKDGETKKGKYPSVDVNNEFAYFVYSDNLQDGYYTGWIAAFYNTSDTFSKGKKKVRTSRVAGYLDATGELLLCNGVPGVGEGWQCVLYTEYTRQIGSRVKPYIEDSYNPSYTSQTNSRYFCLDYFASSADDYYKDWKFEFLYGTAKKVKGQDIYKQDKNKKQYTVFAYDGNRRRIDCAGDENFAKGIRMKPAPTGDEFVTLYDPSSYIFKIFSSNDENEDDEQNEGNNASADGIKMEVSGIVKSYLQGFDKIRLYRASESTETYRLCATLENKTQTFLDNVQESELTTELDYAHAAPTPAKYISSRNARFALAYTNVDNFTAEVKKDAYVGAEALNGQSFAKAGLGFSSPDYITNIVKTAPLVGVRFNQDVKLVAQLPNEEVTESLDLHLLLNAQANDASGVICGLEKRLEQSTLDNRLFEDDTVAILDNAYHWEHAPDYETTYPIPDGYGDWNKPDGFVIESINGIPYNVWPEPPYQFRASYSPGRRELTFECLGTYPHDDMLDWKLVIKKAYYLSESEAVVPVTSFYLNPSAIGQSSAYDNGTLRIIDADGKTQHFNFGSEAEYDGTTRKVTLLGGRTVKLKLKNVDLGDDYVTSGKDVVTTSNKAWMYEPMIYEIYMPSFQIYYENGTPYIFDGGSSKEISVLPFANGAADLLIIRLPAMASNSLLKISFGGQINALRFGDTLDASLYYFTMAKHGVDDPPLISYVTSDLVFKQSWDHKLNGEVTVTDSTKAFATLATLETGGRQASLYVRHENDEPVVPATQLRTVITGYNLLVFDKRYRGADSSITFFAKDAPLEVQITTAGAGLREKVELADVYNFNDGYGTKLTGIVDCRMGFIIFKDRGVYILDPDKRVFQVISHEFGCVAPGSIAEGRGGIFWLSNGGRIEYQDFDNGSAVREIGRGLRPWFQGEQTIGGHSVDWERVEAETTAAFDSDYGDYILAIPCKKNNANTTVILAYNEEYDQWWRIDDTQSHNSAKHAFQFEGRAAFAGGYGIYDFKPDTSYINPWTYESRWRDEGTHDTQKQVKRLHFNNFVDVTRTDEPTASIRFYKDQKTTAEPNFLDWDNPDNPDHPFYTNMNKTQVEVGVRAYVWKFIMSGLTYLKLKGIDVILRKKEDTGPGLEETPPTTSNNQS